MTTTYTLYTIHNSKTGESTNVLRSSEGQVWDFGFTDEFEIAKILNVFNNIEIEIVMISKSAYERTFK